MRDQTKPSAHRRGTCGCSSGVPPYQTRLGGRVALLFGAEGAGLSAALAQTAHARVSIPLARGVESLNVGAAAAVVLFERVRQLATSENDNADGTPPAGRARRR